VKSLFLFLLSSTVLAGPVVAAEDDTRWHVVLAAVGNEQNVFDNFISDFGKELKGSANVASFTELHASLDERWQASGLRTLEATLTALQPQGNEGCLIYLTGHGAPEGLAMSADTPTMFVRSTRMESMLNACAARPTVLVVSACFSGVYLRPGITRPERIVMTASAADLTSFGCSNNNRYTFFDQCFLDAWPQYHQWGPLADEVRRCVRETERSGGFPSSDPQFFFGPGLRDLALPAPG
jgi:Peptidase C13 family